MLEGQESVEGLYRKLFTIINQKTDFYLRLQTWHCLLFNSWYACAGQTWLRE